MAFDRSQLCLPEAIGDRDIGYSSGIWDQYLLSEVLVTPTATSGKGMITLQMIAEDGAESSRDSHKRSRAYGLGIINDTRYLLMINELLNRLKVDDAKEKMAANEVLIHKLQEQLEFYLKYNEKTKNLHDQFELIHRLSGQVLDIQQEYKEEVLKHPMGMVKLAIAIKCLDAAWASLRLVWKEMELLTPTARNPEEYIDTEFVEFEIKDVIIRVTRDRMAGPSVSRIIRSDEEQDQAGSVDNFLETIEEVDEEEEDESSEGPTRND